LGYWAITLPLDTLKTLVQTGKTNSAMNTVSLLVNRDGFYGAVSQLYRGWQMAFGRGTPSAAITLTTYSAVYHFLDEQYR
jgi:solute carrier family 25 carnitine/acylcarnitine transporter 20/29